MRALACIIVCVFAALAHGEPSTVRVIVNAKNHVTRLDRRFVSEAFLKKRTHWDEDLAIQPVDLGQRSAERDKFSRDVLERDVASVRRYWAQQVFSGRGVPPPEVSNDADVVKYVASHPGGIGYVAAGVELSGVKIVEVE
jgi:ABC-type phosphate transport system substrate-binding protein